MRTSATITAAVLLGTVALAGCGDDEADELAVLEVAISGGGESFSIEAPEEFEAGVVEVRVTNSAEGEAPHSLDLIRVDGDLGIEDVLAVVSSEEGAPIPEELHADGGTGDIAAGESRTVTVELTEGRYFLIDTNSVDPETDESASFAELGAQRELTVEGDGGGELPETDLTITAKEYSFDVPELSAGTQRLTYVNDGEELHHVVAVPIADGATIADVEAFFGSEEEPEGPPPLDFEGGDYTGVLDGGTSMVTELELEAGEYAFICFINDRAGGPPHFTKGMLQGITVS